MSILYIKESRQPIEQVGERLEQAVKDHQFGVLGMIDLRAKMREKGVAFERACRIYEVCNPHRAKEVLDRAMSVSTALPCRISVYEEGGVVKVATLLPTATLQMFEVDDMASVAEEVEAAITAMIDDATAP